MQFFHFCTVVSVYLRFVRNIIQALKLLSYLDILQITKEFQTPRAKEPW